MFQARSRGCFPACAPFAALKNERHILIVVVKKVREKCKHSMPLNDKTISVSMCVYVYMFCREQCERGRDVGSRESVSDKTRNLGGLTPGEFS